MQDGTSRFSLFGQDEPTEDPTRIFGDRPGASESRFGLQGESEEEEENTDPYALAGSNYDAEVARRHDMLGAITSELTKSYGLRRDNESGTWSWSMENIAQSFEESPVWTTLDYVLLAVAPIKWGASLFKVSQASRSMGTAKKGLAAGSFEGQRAQSKLGRLTEKAGVSPEFVVAAEFERKHGVPMNGITRYFSSDVARTRDPEWQRVVTEVGYDPMEMRSLDAILEREKVMAAEVMARRGDDLIVEQNRVLGRVGEDAGRRAEFTRAMRTGVTPENMAAMTTLGEDASDVFRKTWEFRYQIHERAYDLGMISDEAYEFNLGTYWPKQYREYMEATKGGRGARAAGKRGHNPMANTKWDEATRQEILDEGIFKLINDPAAGTNALVKAGIQISNQEYVQRLATSAIAKTPEELMANLDELFELVDDGAGYKILAATASTGDANLDTLRNIRRSEFNEAQVDLLFRRRAAAGTAGDVADAATDLAEGVLVRAADRGNIGTLLHFDETGEFANVRFTNPESGATATKMIQLDELTALSGRNVGMSEQYAADLVKEHLGWVPVDELFNRAGIQDYIKRLPPEMRGKMIDPSVAGDIVGMAQFTDMLPDIVAAYVKGTAAVFKVGKTAYNPATHVRNGIGAVIFHSMTVGMADSFRALTGAGSGQGGFHKYGFLFGRGRKTLADGIDNDDFKEVMGLGLIGSAHNTEVARTLEHATGMADAKSVSQWIERLGENGNKYIAGATAKAGTALGKMEQFYRYIDEVAKVDAYLYRRDARIKEFSKSGQWGDDAEFVRQQAMRTAYEDVAKFQPMFSQSSPFTNLVRDVIPFASFTTEAVRIWKNALVEKPHVAFFWNHFAESASVVAGAAAGFSPDELESAKAALPGYVQGKKMMAWPKKVDGKPVFMDLSYMIPMANISEAVSAEATLFDAIQMDPFTHPAASLVYALKTGKDPFSGQKIEPKFAEQQLGADLHGAGRKVVGLVEHAAKMMLPPLVPPGYSGVNLLEWARGSKHPLTGAELEQGALRTIGANVLGVRLYEADVNSQVLNVKYGEKHQNEKLAEHWAQWRWGTANGDPARANKALDNIKAMRRGRGESEKEVNKYVASALKRRELGKYRGISTRHLEEITRRSESLGYKDENDLRALSELNARYQERVAKGKGGG